MENVERKRRVFVGVGANVADARKNVEEAIRFLGALLGEVESSCLYETPCMGNDTAPAYTNAVVSGTTFYDCNELVRVLKAYEQLKGRCRDKSKSVVIDLDIVICNGDVLRERDFNALYFQIGLKEITSWQKQG